MRCERFFFSYLFVWVLLREANSSSINPQLWNTMRLPCMWVILVVQHEDVVVVSGRREGKRNVNIQLLIQFNKKTKTTEEVRGSLFVCLFVLDNNGELLPLVDSTDYCCCCLCALWSSPWRPGACCWLVTLFSSSSSCCYCVTRKKRQQQQQQQQQDACCIIVVLIWSCSI